MPSQSNTQVILTEQVTQLTVSAAGGITVDIQGEQTEISINNTALPAQATAANVVFTPYGQITAQTLDGAIKQLVDLSPYVQDNQPDVVAGSPVSEGNIWYDTDDNQVKIYRETSTGVFEWVPIIVGAAGGDSDTVDAGAF